MTSRRTRFDIAGGVVLSRNDTLNDDKSARVMRALSDLHAEPRSLLDDEGLPYTKGPAG